jgi:hypothetical protein
VIDLMAQYGKRYKVALDPSWQFEKPVADKHWYWELWGRRGWCYIQNPSTLALEIRNSVFPKLERTKPFSYSHVRGGDETQKILVSEPHHDKAVHWLVPRRKRSMTPEQKAQAVARLAKWRFPANDSAR